MELAHRQKENIGLQWVLDETRPNGAYGKKLLKGLHPFGPGQADALRAELGNLEKTLAARPALETEYARLEHLCGQIKDIRASLKHCQNGVLDEVELFEVKRYLIQLAEMAPPFEKVRATAGYQDLALENTADAFALLDVDKTGVASFHISERWSAELASIRRQKKEVEAALRGPAGGGPAASTKAAEGKGATGAASPADGHAVAETASHEALTARRRQLVAEEQAEEARVRQRLSEELRAHLPALLANTDTIARLDLLMAKARLAAAHRCACPHLAEWSAPSEEAPPQALCASFTNMWNPMVAAALDAEGKAFTPVSIRLGQGATVITGANMGGKSVCLKTIALNVYLAQCGFYVFAEEMTAPLFGQMYMLSEDLEDSKRGLSSFGGEIARFNQVDARPRGTLSLILMDEFARGTNPGEGAAIAQSVTAHLNSETDFAVLTTHFDGVAAVAGGHYQVAGLKGADIETLSQRLAGTGQADRVKAIAKMMDYGLYQVMQNEPMPKDALNICRLLGLNDEIITSIDKKLLTFDSARVK